MIAAAAAVGSLSLNAAWRAARSRPSCAKASSFHSTRTSSLVGAGPAVGSSSASSSAADAEVEAAALAAAQAAQMAAAAPTRLEIDWSVAYYNMADMVRYAKAASWRSLTRHRSAAGATGVLLVALLLVRFMYA